MKHYLFSTKLLLVFAFSLLISCNKENEKNIEIPINTEGITKASETHELVLKNLMTNSVNQKDVFDYLKTGITTKDENLPPLDLSEEEYYLFLSKFNQFDYSEFIERQYVEEVINILMKEKLFEIVALVETSVDDVNGLDVELAVQKLLQKEEEIFNQNFMSVQEKEFIITCSTVCRSSLVFWDDYVKENYVGKRPWWNIVLSIAFADATGVGIGYLSFGSWIAGGIIGAAVSYRVGEVLINE